jgi:hypothetical protein
VAAAKALSVPIDQLRWLSDTELNFYMSDMASLGSKFLRVDLSWNAIQLTSAQNYNFAEFDRVVDAARAKGLKVLLILMGTPSWAAQAGTNVPADPSTYAAFARNAALHYAPKGVHHFEIWNEPNLTGFFSTMSVSRYTSLLKAAYPAIHAADSQAVVLSAGLSPVASTGATYTSATDFMAGIYSNGGKGSFDAVGFHPYSWPLFPSNTAGWNGWMIMSGNSTSIRSIMVANGDSAKQIWITEFGAPSNNVGEANQAAMIQEAFDMARGLNFMGPLFVYTYKDRGTDTSDTENFFGLIRYNGSQKPSYSTFKALP